MYLLDTNIVSALRRPEKAPQTLRVWAAEIAAADMYLSVITLYEIELGIRQIGRRDQPQATILQNWFERNVRLNFRTRILPVTEEIAMRSAALHVPDPKPERDAFIAATAFVHGLTIVTRNVRDFHGMGSTLLNPWP